MAANDTLSMGSSVVTAKGAAMDTGADEITFVATTTAADGYQIS